MFFAKGEIIMNNIYKVIWSKAKNCYVVASEIAKSHTKSASGSEKMGGYGKRALLALAAASAIFCGGLVNVGASVQSETISAGTTSNPVLTVDNTDDAAQLNKVISAARDDKLVTKDNISDQLTGYAKASDLSAKADATTVNDISTRVDKLETTVGNDASGLVKDVAEAKTDITNIKNTIGDDTTGLIKEVNDKANQSDLDAATDRITTAEGKITKLETKTGNLSTDGKSLAGMDAVSGTTVSGDTVKAGSLNVTGTITDGANTTTLSDIKNSMTQTESNRKDIATLKTTTGEQDTAIKDLQKKTTNISYADGAGTSIDGITVKDGNIVGNGNSAITGLTNVETSQINGKSLAGTTVATMTEVEAAVKAETDARTEADNKLEEKITKNSNDIATLDGKVTTAQGDIQTNANNIQANSKAIADTNKRTGGIARNLEDTQTTIEGSVKVDNKGNVKDVEELSAKKITTTEDAVIGGDLKVTGETTLSGELKAEKDATFEKNVTVEKDLTVNGKLNVDKISLKNDELKNGKKHDSATTITADEISNLAKVTEQGNTTESQFTHNEKGTFNYAKDEKSTGEWKRATSNVTADGVSNKMTDSDGNTHTYYQTATETKEQLVNGDKSNFEKKTAEGNTISIKDKDADGNKKSLTNTQTVDEEKTSVTNKDSSSTIKQGADQIRNYVASTDGTKSSTEVKADGITNTSDGTITNDANHIENKANTMDTTVTGKATESYGGLETTVNGNETHTVTGNQENTIDGSQTTTVKGKVTENYKAGQETNVTGNQDIKVSGTQTTTATDINRNASSGMIDTIDNDYGTNTETKVAGKTTTDVSIKGTGEEGKYIRGANESRDYLIKGTLKNSETKTAEATSTEITDGNGKTSATIQDKTQISGSVTNGTSSAVSNVKADSIDTAVIEGTNTSLISQKKDSITSAVGNRTTSTVIQQGDKDITIASNGGTVGIVGKDIINNATNEITNTAGTKITDKVGNNTRVIDQTSITDTVGTASRKIEDGKITDTAGDSTVTTENGKGTTFAKTGSTAYSAETGATLDTKIAGNYINTGRVDANELGVSDKDDQGNTAGLSVKAGEGNKGGIKGYATDKDGNKTYTKVTATENSFQVQDKDGNIKNHQVNTKDKSENTIKNGDKTNTVTSTADGTTFNNSEAAAPVTGASGAGTAVNTTIKGNTITTGKVTMDYADVMKDLGVKGNTTLGEVGKDTTLTVNSKATFNNGLTVTNGETKLKNTTIEGTLNVFENATFQKDVTAKSFSVNGKTYIDSDGLNANNQVIRNVADGSISEGSKDAVNGGQLYNVKNDLEGKVNKVGANAAAMANLHPMEFDPDSKWNIAAAIGNYGSETAAALGAFYRPNDDVMVNLSTAFGTGENMVGGGVSVRLGKGGNKLSREESNALKDQVNDLTARMDALLSVLNPNMSKDFPDVPENHWAYEAVSRLAGNDIVQGYPDGEFHGERTMTRYEMAEIIYNALSRGAEAEKELVEEFKPELQAMAASEKATAERAEG